MLLFSSNQIKFGKFRLVLMYLTKNGNNDKFMMFPKNAMTGDEFSLNEAFPRFLVQAFLSVKDFLELFLLSDIF